MSDITNISVNRIIGELIEREKYFFVEGCLIASIVDDTVAIVKREVEKLQKKNKKNIA